MKTNLSLLLNKPKKLVTEARPVNIGCNRKKIIIKPFQLKMPFRIYMYKKTSGLRINMFL